jgi:hypothetical protein
MRNCGSKAQRKGHHKMSAMDPSSVQGEPPIKGLNWPRDYSYGWVFFATLSSGLSETGSRPGSPARQPSWGGSSDRVGRVV